MGNVQMCVGGGGGYVGIRLNGMPGTQITATLGARTITGTIGADGILQSKLPGLGLWHVTAQSGEYSFDQDLKVYRYGITEGWVLANKPFYDCTPAEIQAIARSGMASQYWQIGDRHKITLETGEEIYVEIADFNHDIAPSGALLPLTIIMEDCFAAKMQMNSSSSNASGWSNCNLRTGTLPGIKSSFPAEWQEIMATAQKKTCAGSGSSVIITTDDDLWLLSEIEIFGIVKHSDYGEGSIYPIFTDNASRVARVNGVASSWWARSPAGATSTSFCIIDSDGSTNTNYANGSLGVRVGFCVG